uniref:Amidohydrolase n=1 Tax=Solibacter usitatus (strain Ellin6076) TaxID=234267 RepID=Q021L6_SOLUE
MYHAGRTWRLIRNTALALASARFSGAQAGSPHPAGSASVAITDVTVIDVATGRLRSGVTVVTHADRIAGIGPDVAIPRGAARVNGKGRFLIPGLWDMHSHHQGTGADCLDLFIAKGVVGTRDMGGDLDFILPLRERVASGAVLGPEIVASGPILDDAPLAYPYRRRVTNAQQAREAVADLKRAGVDFIKVHDHTPREVFFTIAAEAPKVGLPFAGHVPQGVKIEEAADAGMRSIEHLSNYDVFGECLVNEAYTLAGCRRLFEKLAAKGVWQTPTLAFFEAIPDLFSGRPLDHADYASDALLKLTRDNIQHSHVPAVTLEKMRLAGKVSLQVIPDMYSLGNRFLAGCDGLVPGFCLHDELEWFTRAGFSPLQALQTATINPARFLGREDTQGAIEVGKRADLILLRANPLVDIRNVSQIEDVVVRGKLVTKQQIDRIIAGHRRANR